MIFYVLSFKIWFSDIKEPVIKFPPEDGSWAPLCTGTKTSDVGKIISSSPQMLYTHDKQKKIIFSSKYQNIEYLEIKIWTDILSIITIIQKSKHLKFKGWCCVLRYICVRAWVNNVWQIKPERRAWLCEELKSSVQKFCF